MTLGQKFGNEKIREDPSLSTVRKAIPKVRKMFVTWTQRMLPGEELYEKMRGLCNHMCNIHSWPEDNSFDIVHECEHSQTDTSECDSFVDVNSAGHNILVVGRVGINIQYIAIYCIEAIQGHVRYCFLKGHKSDRSFSLPFLVVYSQAN